MTSHPRLCTYSEWAPTDYDTKGAHLDDDRQSWLVVPVLQTRDSEPLDQSNFDAALAILGGESETVEVHRFGHWGPGWVEIIIVAPERAADVEAIADKLESYPVLDDDDLSEREWEAACESWDNWGRSEFRSMLVTKYGADDALAEAIEELSDEMIDRLACSHPTQSLPDFETHSDGPYFRCLDRSGDELPSEEEVRAAIDPLPHPPADYNPGQEYFDPGLMFPPKTAEEYHGHD